jgi:hypothetical protein
VGEAFAVRLTSWVDSRGKGVSVAWETSYSQGIDPSRRSGVNSMRSHLAAVGWCLVVRCLMCWALYFASDRELPHIPWEETRPSFNTQPLSETEAPVKEHFSLPNVIYLGSHQGCGCGFISVDEDEPEEKELRNKTVQALSSYLNAALQNGARLEVFLCWEGDQAETPAAKKSVSTREFLNPVFPLGEKEFADVVI